MRTVTIAYTGLLGVYSFEKEYDGKPIDIKKAEPRVRLYEYA